MKHSLSMIGVLLLALALCGCPKDQQLTTLEGVLAATEVTLGVLEQTNPQNAQIYASVANALVGLPVAFQQTEAELATVDDSVTKSLKIASYYAPTVLVINQLPPTAKVIAQGIYNAIQAYLKATQPTTVPTAGRLRPPSKAIHLPSKIQDRIFSITERVGLLQK